MIIRRGVDMLHILIITILFFGIVWLMGSVCLKICSKNMDNESPVFLGFFMYYALFQMVALPLIFSFSSLSKLSLLWIICVVVLCSIGVWCVKSHFKRIYIKEIFTCGISAIDILMIVLVMAQILLALVQIYNGWDTAYYIANVNTAVKTNTMYVYEGSVGKLESVLNLRYALSSFYMHDAVIAQVFNIPGEIVCRYFNGIVCHAFSAYIIYKIGFFLWAEKKWAKLLVICSVLVNCGITTVYFSNAFLMERSYEAKAFCSNIIIPAIIYIILKIYRAPDKQYNWIYLFIVNFSSIAISESSLLLVPLLNGCMLLGHCLIEKSARNLGKMIVCILPNILYLSVYFLYQIGRITIKIPG